LAASGAETWRCLPGGVHVPPVFYEVYSGRGWYLDNGDFLTYGIRGHVVSDATVAVRLFRQYLFWLMEERPAEFEALIAPLRGKSKQGFCKVGDECHADVWMEFCQFDES